MKRRVSFSSAAAYLLPFVFVTVLSAGIAAAQTAATDTSSQAASSSVGITVTVTRDTTRKAGDTLTVAPDTTGGTLDTLAITPDTTGAKRDTLAAKKDTLEILTSNASYNTVPGFRVQILTTQNLNEAIGAKAEADSLLPNYNIYIVYDSPYYKVRVGDFRARYEAAQAVTYIADHGFPNAWSVPDNVFRNPVHRNN